MLQRRIFFFCYSGVKIAAKTRFLLGDMSIQAYAGTK